MLLHSPPVGPHNHPPHRRYFGVITIFMFLPTSSKNPISQAGTLFFIMMVSAVKEFYEDMSRRREDKAINTRHVKRLNRSSKRFEDVLWQNVRIGDIIKVRSPPPRYVRPPSLRYPLPLPIPISRRCTRMKS